MNSSAKQILIGWIYRRIGFLKHGMKKQIKPLAAILRFLDFSIPPYRHFERSEKSSLHSTLSCFLRRSILVFYFHTYDIIPSCQKDPSTSLGMTLRGIALSKYIRWMLREIIPFPHTVISSTARNLPCTLLFLASFAKGFPFSAVSHRTLYQYARKIEGSARDDDTGIALSKHIRWTLREINPFPPTVISSAARNLPCTLLFLASFAKVFPFSTITHTTLSPPARKIPRLRSG